MKRNRKGQRSTYSQDLLKDCFVIKRIGGNFKSGGDRRAKETLWYAPKVELHAIAMLRHNEINRHSSIGALFDLSYSTESSDWFNLFRPITIGTNPMPDV